MKGSVVFFFSFLFFNAVDAQAQRVQVSTESASKHQAPMRIEVKRKRSKEKKLSENNFECPFPDGRSPGRQINRRDSASM